MYECVYVCVCVCIEPQLKLPKEIVILPPSQPPASPPSESHITVMCHSTTGTHSEKCIVRRFHHYADRGHGEQNNTILNQAQ